MLWCLLKRHLQTDFGIICCSIYKEKRKSSVFHLFVLIQLDLHSLRFYVTARVPLCRVRSHLNLPGRFFFILSIAVEARRRFAINCVLDHAHHHLIVRWLAKADGLGRVGVVFVLA